MRYAVLAAWLLCVSAKAAPHVRLVGLGDSVTAGYGASPRHSYFQRLQRRAPDDPGDTPSLGQVFPHLAAQNLAVSGSVWLGAWLLAWRLGPCRPPVAARPA